MDYRVRKLPGSPNLK